MDLCFKLMMTIIDSVSLCSYTMILEVQQQLTVPTYLYQGIWDISLESSCFSKALLNQQCHSHLLNWGNK